MNPTQLLALGGGGFTDPAARPLDDFALELAGRDRPRVCLLATASGDASAYVAAFYRTFADRAECAHVSLFQRDGRDMRSLVLGQDLLYVGGGNTANLLALWRLHGVDAIVRDAYQAGVVIAGVSAGACALFEAGVSASFGAIAPLHDGLGLVPGGFCPHWHERRGVLLEMVSGGLSGGCGAGDDAALLFVDGELREAVGLRPDADAFRVESGPVEVRVPVRSLASSAS